MQVGQTVYLSRYCLTEGIVEDVATVVDEHLGLARIGGRPFVYYHIGVDLHELREQAIVAAEVERQKKIKATQKRLQKLEAMVF